MEFITAIADIMLDGKHRPSKKVLLAVFSFCIALFIDRFLYFSDSFIVSNKLHQVEEIEKLLENDKIDSTTRKCLKKMESAVLQREPVWNYLGGLKESIISLISSQKAINPITKRTNNINNLNIERSVFWHTFTSAWLIFICMGISIFIPFFNGQKIDGFTVFTLMLLEIIFLIFVLILSYLFSLIPIFEKPIINYIINFVGSGTICLLLFFMLDKLRKRTQEKDN